MSTTIEVHDGESIDSALKRLTQLVRRDLHRPWHKRRYGYYEKPSELRRKQEKMARLRAGAGTLLLRIGLKELYARTGPRNAAGR
jgi:ribosomal protein S21